MINMDKYIKKAEILIEALPYIQGLSGKTIVIKYGGNAMINNELKTSVMDDITLLKFIGTNPIIVHGGGPEINKTLKVMNIPTQFVNGLRVTDEATMTVVQSVLVGTVNKEIVSMINKTGGKAVGLCGIDAKLIECEPEKAQVNGESVDLGYVGKITNINAKVLETLAKDGYIPVVAPIGVGVDGHSYNINADTVAGELAATLKAEKLILLTDVPGIQSSSDHDDVIPFLSIEQTKEMINNGVITGGMIPKVLGCIKAAEAGVNRTHIIDGRIPHSLLLEIFTNKGIGSMIFKDRTLYHKNEKVYMAQ